MAEIPRVLLEGSHSKHGCLLFAHGANFNRSAGFNHRKNFVDLFIGNSDATPSPIDNRVFARHEFATTSRMVRESMEIDITSRVDAKFSCASDIAVVGIIDFECSVIAGVSFFFGDRINSFWGFEVTLFDFVTHWLLAESDIVAFYDSFVRKQKEATDVLANQYGSDPVTRTDIDL